MKQTPSVRSSRGRHAEIVSRLLTSALRLRLSEFRLRRTLLRCFVEAAGCRTLVLSEFINQVPLCGNSRFILVSPKRVFRRLLEMSSILRRGGDTGEFPLCITWEPCDYSVRVQAIGTKELKVSFIPIPGTERKTEEDRQAIVRRLFEEMKGGPKGVSPVFRG